MFGIGTSYRPDSGRTWDKHMKFLGQRALRVLRQLSRTDSKGGPQHRESPSNRVHTFFFQVNTNSAVAFDSTTLPLGSPFLGDTGYYHMFGIGDNTGSYTVTYTPLVRGDYTVTVKKPPVWEKQLILTRVDETGEDLSGAL